MSFPQKRHKSLQPLSREHHQALLLCWKLRQGFSKAVDTERIKKYADWFWLTYLAPHFEAEEKHFFPLLDQEHPGIIKALKQHKELKKLFTGSGGDIAYNLRQIAFELEQHIRFEERDLFNDIQAAATPEQLLLLEKAHTEEKFEENIEDMFWVEKAEPKSEKKEARSEKKEERGEKREARGEKREARSEKKEGRGKRGDGRKDTRDNKGKELRSGGGRQRDERDGKGKERKPIPVIKKGMGKK